MISLLYISIMYNPDNKSITQEGRKILLEHLSFLIMQKKEYFSSKYKEQIEFSTKITTILTDKHSEFKDIIEQLESRGEKFYKNHSEELDALNDRKKPLKLFKISNKAEINLKELLEEIEASGEKDIQFGKKIIADTKSEILEPHVQDLKTFFEMHPEALEVFKTDENSEEFSVEDAVTALTVIASISFDEMEQITQIISEEFLHSDTMFEILEAEGYIH